jgi:hypothetical protein
MGNTKYAYFVAKYSADILPDSIQSIKVDELLGHFSNVIEYRSMPYQQYAVYAVIFFKTKDQTELTTLLNLDLNQFVVTNTKMENENVKVVVK